jgi:hypothetical protein
MSTIMSPRADSRNLCGTLHSICRSMAALWLYKLRRTQFNVNSAREAPPQPISPITGEELQVKFLSDSEENSLTY